MVEMPTNVKKAVESIREIVGNNHSDNDVLNALKDSFMDPNDAISKLLHQGHFHEVRKRRDKKKENTDYNGQAETRKHNGYTSQGPEFYSHHNNRRGGYARRGISREFHVVEDGRSNQNSAKLTRPPAQATLSGMARRVYNIPDFRPKEAREFNYNTRKGYARENTAVTKPNELELQSGKSTSSNVVGFNAPDSDSVRVPSYSSRSPAAISMKRREIGIGSRRYQSSESRYMQYRQQSAFKSNTELESSSVTELSRHREKVSRSAYYHGTAVESVIANSDGSRFSNRISYRSPLQSAAQKGMLHGKEWKPKTNQNPSSKNKENVERETDELQDKMSEMNIHDTQKVTIAQNIQVSKFDRCILTFGNIGTEFDSIEDSSPAFQAADPVAEAASSINNQNGYHFQGQIPASSSASGESSENQLPNKHDSFGVPDTQNYSDMKLVLNSSSSTTSRSEHPQESIGLPNFSVYDPQPAYDMAYFRPSVDDASHGTGLPSNQEVPSSQTANIIRSSSVVMMQQQTPIAQMYPQFHTSKSTNGMAYHQFIPPMYGPCRPSMVPACTNNPGYPHLFNGSSYVLLPGDGSHVLANNLELGLQEFKPTGYAVNAPGVVGGSMGLDNSSRLIYKDNNLHILNPQVETSEVWMQNRRDHPNMQSTAYLNLEGQEAHLAYKQSQRAFLSFNPQLSQMQFPGVYPPQPASIPISSHLGVGMQPPANHLNWASNYREANPIPNLLTRDWI